MSFAQLAALLTAMPEQRAARDSVAQLLAAQTDSTDGSSEIDVDKLFAT